MSYDLYREFRQYSDFGYECIQLAKAHAKAWRVWHASQGHDAYKRGMRAYCRTCELEFIFTEEQAYQVITGQTAEEAAAWFEQLNSIAARWRELAK